MPIRNFTQSGAFDPEAIGAMAKAFDAAREKVTSISPKWRVSDRRTNYCDGQDLVSVTPLACWKPRSANRTSRVFASMARSHGRAAEWVLHFAANEVDKRNYQSPATKPSSTRESTHLAPGHLLVFRLPVVEGPRSHVNSN